MGRRQKAEKAVSPVHSVWRPMWCDTKRNKEKVRPFHPTRYSSMAKQRQRQRQIRNLCSRAHSLTLVHSAPALIYYLIFDFGQKCFSNEKNCEFRVRDRGESECETQTVTINWSRVRARAPVKFNESRRESSSAQH